MEFSSPILYTAPTVEPLMPGPAASICLVTSSEHSSDDLLLAHRDYYARFTRENPINFRPNYAASTVGVHGSNIAIYGSVSSGKHTVCASAGQPQNYIKLYPACIGSVQTSQRSNNLCVPNYFHTLGGVNHD
jgi:hypothetical protein